MAVFYAVKAGPVREDKQRRASAYIPHASLQREAGAPAKEQWKRMDQGEF